MVPRQITFAVFYLVQIAISDAVPPECSYWGKAFTSRNRKRIFDEVVGATHGSTALEYSCQLEEKARPLLKQGQAEPPLVQMKYEEGRSGHHNAATFFKKAVQSWSEELGKLGTKSLFGCNFSTKNKTGKFTVVCLFQAV
ncbi:hypothetical protein ANCCAN_04228 [Ancylostoma caninum]|uniref:SCP domain-containing protein n=1 Tax=Ancylostoma caninum TaxID=29170 RepID=A0A368GZG9_ANCCA|nr:hypothetical protein ANCCAN_04228 [Ancylostoma caninum]